MSSRTAADEIELKLLADPEALACLEAVGGVLAVGQLRKRSLLTVYWDTPGLDLAASGLALRMRREGGVLGGLDADRWIYALKTLDRAGNSAESGVPARQEWEWPAPLGGTPDLSLLAGHPALTGRFPDGIPGLLRPLFHSRIHRTQWVQAVNGGGQVEVALDRGEVRAGCPDDRGPGQTVPVSEVELELREGPVSALFILALAFHAQVPLTLARGSKAETGFALVTGRARPPPTPLESPPGAEGGEVPLSWFRAGLARLAWSQHRTAALGALAGVLDRFPHPGAAALAAEAASSPDLTAFALRLGLWLEGAALTLDSGED